MSKGLGKIQKAILINLDRAMDEWVKYQNDHYSTGRTPWWLEINYLGKKFYVNREIQTLQPGIIPKPLYDLEIVSRYLAERYGGMDRQFITQEWSATFSRAIRSLKRQGYLLDLPPDGCLYGKKTRFVCKTQKAKEYLVKLRIKEDDTSLEKEARDKMVFGDI